MMARILRFPLRFIFQLLFVPLRLPGWLYGKIANLFHPLIFLDYTIPARIPESGPAPPLARFLGAPSGPGILEILLELRKAARHPTLTTVVFRMDTPQYGWGRLWDLSEAIAHLRSRGKTVIFYLENCGNKELFLSSFADYVVANPLTPVLVHQFQLETLHLSKFLKEYQIKADFLAMGKYKSMGEMFTRQQMSPAARQALDKVIHSLRDRFVRAIAENRDMKFRAVDKILSAGPQSAADLREAGLFHELMYADELPAWTTQKLLERLEAILEQNAKGSDRRRHKKISKRYRRESGQAGDSVKSKKQKKDNKQGPVSKGDSGKNPEADTGADTMSADAPGWMDNGDFSRHLSRRERKLMRLKSPVITALVYFDGGIHDGSLSEPARNQKGISDKRFIPLLRSVRSNPHIQGVILRINSPGGSATASDRLFREVQLLARAKPTIVSFGDVAASGGYYIASGARQVFAAPFTITGSIGVIMGKFNLSGLYQKYGFSRDKVSTGKNSDIWSDYSGFSPEVRKKLKNHLKEMYDSFLNRVAYGREKKPADIHPMAQGRVWLGDDAREKGLVDETRGLTGAITQLRKNLKLKSGDRMAVMTLPEVTVGSVLSQRMGRRFSLGALPFFRAPVTGPLRPGNTPSPRPEVEANLTNSAALPAFLLEGLSRHERDWLARVWAEFGTGNGPQAYLAGARFFSGEAEWLTQSLN